MRRVALLGGLGGAAALTLLPDNPHVRRVRAFGEATVRASRLVRTVGAMGLDYRLTSATTPEERDTRHQRNAERLLALVEANHGVYIKIAQHLAQLEHLLPLPYCHTLRSTLDATPKSSWESVCATLREDLGKDPTELYASIEREPLASASLAQVHEATDWEGRRLAVKVQHRGLAETSVGDCDGVELLVRIVCFVFPEFPFGWLVDEIMPNLPRELDFLLEGANCERCGEQFSGSANVTVPRVLWEQSSKRVLTMTFEEGSRIDDVKAIEAAGLRPADVAALVSFAFSQQAMRFGFVHCDPHAANLLVRPIAPGSTTPQLVLLDHGLYRSLGTEFRLEYCRLWRAMVRGDVKEVERVCRALNSGDAFPLLASMIAARPWSDVKSSDLEALRGPSTGHDPVVRAYASRYATDIVEMLNRVSPELLLLLKAQDCLRCIDKRLGAPINTFETTLRTATSVLAAEAPSSKWEAWTAPLDTEMRIQAYKWGKWLRSSRPL